MFKFFKKEGEEKQTNMVKGLAYGLGGALIILIIVLLVVFGGKIKNKITGGTDNNGSKTEVSADAPKLRITVLTSKNCGTECFDINLFLDALRQNNINETGLETLNIEDKEGKELAEKYAITKVPTVLIAGELDKNPQLAQAWPSLGEIVDGVFVFRQVIPPYLDIASGTIKGKFSLVYLSDKSCTECYDVKLHDVALQNLGLKPQNTQEIDVSSDDGKALLAKYDITAVPTIIMTGELGEYASLKQIWPQVGNISDDGAYVFTKLDEMGSYKDLDKGEIVKVAPPQAETT